MFSLSYQLMTQTLQRMHYTGTAQATIPSGPFVGGTLSLHVQSGKLLANAVVMPDGRQITDTRLIIESLRHVDVLEWNLTANPASTSPSSETVTPLQPFTPHSPTPLPDVPNRQTPPSSGADVLSPYSYPRRMPVDPTWMSTWPFMYRQVYNLSTGHYSEQDIGRLLRYPLDELVKVFDDLQRMNVIQRRT
jgi:hypothetical protein